MLTLFICVNLMCAQLYRWPLFIFGRTLGINQSGKSENWTKQWCKSKMKRVIKSIRVVREDWYSLLNSSSGCNTWWFISFGLTKSPLHPQWWETKEVLQLPACFNIPSHKSADGSLKLRRTVRHIELMWMNLASTSSCTGRTPGSQHGLFPPPLRGLSRRFLCLTLLLTLRHGSHSLLQPPHLLPILPADLPVWTQGFTARE